MSIDWNAWNQGIIEEFRANGGKVGGNFEGAEMVIVHTTGAKTGAERLNPLVPLIEDGRIYVIASKGGAPDSPDWYYNMKAHPRVTVEHLTETFEADAVEIEDEAERSRLYDLQITRFASFGDRVTYLAREATARAERAT